MNSSSRSGDYGSSRLVFMAIDRARKEVAWSVAYASPSCVLGAELAASGIPMSRVSTF